MIKKLLDRFGRPMKGAKSKSKGYRSDVALTPKEKKPYYWPGKKPEILVDGEAKRLFSTSMVTKNRELRVSGPELDQLEALGLPPFRDERGIAEWFGIERSSLWYFANHRFDDRVDHYVQFAVPKRTGGERIIKAPKRGLKALQRQLLRGVIEKLPVHDAAHGFLKSRSIATHAAPHVNKLVVVKFDLTDFFGTVTFARVRGLLVNAGYDYVVATSLALLCTEANRQRVELANGEIRYAPVGHRYCVQGAPTSPHLCNAVCKKMDARLTGYAAKNDWVYTRYADDLTFSSETGEGISNLLGTVRTIVEEEGFVLNAKKTKVMRKGGAQRVTGVMVNEVLSVPRNDRRRVRAMIHQMKKSGDTSSLPEIEGFIAFAKMINKEQGDALSRLLSSEE